MNFKELNKLLEAFSQYKYNIPKDKEQLLFDFYMLTGLKVPNNNKLRTSYIDARNTIVEYLVKHLKESLFFAISAEFRHVFSQNSAQDLKKFFNKLGYKDFIKKYAIVYKIKQSNAGEFLDDDRLNLVNRFKESDRGYQDSYEALKKTKLSDKKIIELARIAFLKLKWASSYGGKPWAGIADGWLMLDKAKSINDKIIAIDHAYDLQHNTDTVFNKLKNYYKSGYSWIKKSLDKKANLKELFEIYDDISSGLKSFAAAVIKDTENKTLEMFLGIKDKDKDKDKNVSDSNRIVNNYKNFTGLIKYKYTINVKNATLKINNINNIITWQSGTWKGGDWEDGIWKDGTWIKGVWYNGEWYNGEWNDGEWYDGIWKNGKWNSGDWNDGIWEKGIWNNGFWQVGTWNNGTWNNGTWYEGIWNNGTWYEGEWYDGIWKNGTWIKGIWNDGIWENGIWKNGDWLDGTWEQGWIYDPDKRGNYKDNWEWKGKSVKSPISPKEYFK